MKSRKPILYLTIVFALVCFYHLSFTWKVNSINAEKIEYAETKFEENKNNAILAISKEDIANDLRKGKINQDFINYLNQSDTSYSGKEIVFSLDDSIYYDYEFINKKDSLQITDNPTRIDISTNENGDTIYKTILNEGYAIYNVSDIPLQPMDSVELKQKFIEDSLAIENDYALNKTLKLNKLEEDYVRSISFDGTKDKGIYLFNYYTYQDCLDKQINLGLDLKGGISVTLEVDIRDVLVNWANDRFKVQYKQFESKLDNADEKMKDGSADYLDLVKNEYSDELDAMNDLSKVFSGREFEY